MLWPLPAGLFFGHFKFFPPRCLAVKCNIHGAHPGGSDEESIQIAYSVELHLNSNMLLLNRVYKCTIFSSPFLFAPSFSLSFNLAGFRIMELILHEDLTPPKEREIDKTLGLSFSNILALSFFSQILSFSFTVITTESLTLANDYIFPILPFW